jgi:hypothetical protein
VSPFGPMYHFGTTVSSFKSVPDMGKDKWDKNIFMDV